MLSKITDLNIGNNRRLHLGIVGAQPNENEIQNSPEQTTSKVESIFESSHDFKAELDKSMKLHISRAEFDQSRRASRTANKFPLSKSVIGCKNYPYKIYNEVYSKPKEREIYSDRKKPYGVNSESSFYYIPFRNVMSTSSRKFNVLNQCYSDYKLAYNSTKVNRYKVQSTNGAYRMALRLPTIFNRDSGICSKTCDVRQTYGPLLKKV